MFEHGMRVVAPFLLNSYYSLLCRVFLGVESPFYVDTSDSHVFIESPNALTVPLQSQIYTFLNRCFEVLECPYHYTRSNLPTPYELAHVMQTASQWSTITILFGTTPNGEVVTFGLHSLEPQTDGLGIKSNIEEPPNYFNYERCSIFHLAPVQDVFRGIVGKPGWTNDEESITIGEGGGVVMILRDHFRKGEVRHQLSGEDKTTSTYEANRTRGDWSLEFEIEEIAILRERIDESDEE